MIPRPMIPSIYNWSDYWFLGLTISGTTDSLGRLIPRKTELIFTQFQEAEFIYT